MSRRLAVSFGLLALVTLLPAWALDTRPTAAKPGEWPGWRGPQRDNISPDTGLLDKWPQGGPRLAWKVGGLGKGYSSVSVAGGRIYCMGDRDGEQQVIALALADGKEQWSTRVGDEWSPNDNGGPRCTPTVDGNRVYVVGTHGDLVCLEADNGHEVWRRNFPHDFGGRMHSGWGYSESPLVDGDRVICTPGGPDAGIVALDKKTGKDVWKSKFPQLGGKGGDGAAYSSIVIGNGAGVRQYVQLVGRGAVGVRASDGKFLWGYNPVANGVAIIPTPLVHEDYVFCSSGYGDGGTALLHLTASGDGVTADEVYFKAANELQNHHGGMVMIGDYVYLGHGHNAGAPTCVEWKTGKTVWRQNRGPGERSAALTSADGKLYFRWQNGVVGLVNATPEKYEELGTFRIPDGRDPSWPHPVVIGGKLYLRDQDNLLCYDVKK